jgi:hypothetical protein
LIKSQNIKVKPYLLIYTSFFGQKQKSPILYLKIVISWVVYPEGFSRVPDPNHKFWIQIHNTIFCLKRNYVWSTFVYLNIFNGQMFKYAQSLGSILREFPASAGGWNCSKKVEWNDSLKKPGLLILAIYVEANNE